jgi:thioredoxin reductase
MAVAVATPDAKPLGGAPPGSYPVVVVGSGPGGLQAAYQLSRLGISHAVISADPAPGGMFRRYPFFQRLLSWTKPHARVPRHTREYERFDWNSLVAREPENRAVMAELMDGSSEFPSRAEMEAGLRLFAERTGLQVRYETPWLATRRDGTAWILETPVGEYRARVVIFAVGVAEPVLPQMPGIEHARHYVDTRDAASYAGRRLFIIGKQNSAFELASGLLQWANPIILASPRPAQLSVNLHSLGGVRARYVQPLEDAALGGGVFILDAAIERLERCPTGIRVHTRLTGTSQAFVVEVDEVIAASGFRAPLQDLAEVGVTAFGRSSLPLMTNAYESATAPGIYFAGTIGQGVAGLRKYGIPANSGAVHGHRYNTRLLVDDIAVRHFGMPRERPDVPPDAVVDRMLLAATSAPELWHQKSYLAQAFSRDPDDSIRDEGIVSLAEYLDAGGPDGAAITVETDDRGDIHPIVYVRRHGRVDGDARLSADPLHDFRGADQHRELTDLLVDVLA